MNIVSVNAQTWATVTNELNLKDQLYFIPARRVDNGTHQIIHPQVRDQIWDHLWDAIWDESNGETD